MKQKRVARAGKVCLRALGIVAFCAGVLLLSGCGNPVDQTAHQGFYYGFWAGNVEVVPARPSELPARFFEKAPRTAHVPIDSQGRPIRMDPAKVKKPLWVFADEVSLQSVADKIHAAVAAERPIVIVGASESAIEEVFGQTINSHMSSDLPLTRLAWSWLPWMTQHLTEGELVSSWNPSTENGQALYYGFLVDSTLRLVPPGTVSGPATAQSGQDGVSSALDQTLKDVGVPVKGVTPDQDANTSKGYLVVLQSSGAAGSQGPDDPVNATKAIEQGAALAAKGMPITAVHVKCVDASGETVLEIGKSVDPSQVKPSGAVSQDALSALQTALATAADAQSSRVAALVAVQRKDLSVGQDANGLVQASVTYQVADVTAAKTALDDSLVQGVVQSCLDLAQGTKPPINTVVIAVTDSNGNKLLNYFENLDTGSITAFHTPGIGMGWTTASGPADRQQSVTTQRP